MTLEKGHNSAKGDIPDFLKKNTGQLFFDEESIYEISKPYPKFGHRKLDISKKHYSQELQTCSA